MIEGRLAKCESKFDCWAINICNAIASKSSSKWPTDPADSQNSPTHILVANDEFN